MQNSRMIGQRTIGILGAKKSKITFQNISEKDFSSLYFIVALQYNVQIATIYCLVLIITY